MRLKVHTMNEMVFNSIFLKQVTLREELSVCIKGWNFFIKSLVTRPPLFHSAPMECILVLARAAGLCYCAGLKLFHFFFQTSFILLHFDQKLLLQSSSSGSHFHENTFLLAFRAKLKTWKCTFGDERQSKQSLTGI